MFTWHRLARALLASFALLALAMPSAFAVFCAMDTGAVHSHTKAQTDPESHHHGSDDGSNGSESHGGHHGDQDDDSANCCQQLIGSGTALIATTTPSLGVPLQNDFPVTLPADQAVDAWLCRTMEPGFFSQDSGPPYGRPPCSIFGRAPPVHAA